MSHLQTGLCAVAAVMAALLTSVPVTGTQGLGELAQAEAARRAAMKEGGRTLTAQDLKPAPGGAPAQMVAATAPAAESAASSATAAAGTDAAGAAESTPPGADGVIVETAREKRDEPYWRKRFTETRAAVSRAVSDAEAVEARLASLDAELQNDRLLGSRRRELSADREAAALALRRFKQDAADLGRELAALEALARDLKVPSGWTR